jgi:hypothetical protein
MPAEPLPAASAALDLNPRHATAQVRCFVYLRGLLDARLLDRPAADALARRTGAKALEAAAAQANQVREWSRNWLTRWCES